jgi:hypothetical protein
MADNVGYTPGEGAQIAADDIGGVFYQRVKLTTGADGTADDVSAASPLPVTASALPLPSGAATEATLATLAGTIAASNSVYVPGSNGQIVLARRRDADTSPATDGDLTVLNIDDEGRLKVASKPASYANVTGNITANGQTVFVDCVRFSNLMIHCTGTFSTVNVIFEGSLNSTNGTDGNWFTVQAIRSNANTIETTTGNLSAAPAYAWELSVNALKFFRVRATAFTSGTQVWTFVPGTYATEPIPGAQISGTQPISGSIGVNAGTNLIGDVGVQVRANATGAASTHHIVSAATTNVAQIKATAGRVYGYCLSNTTASWRYVKLHNVASATAGAAVAVTIGIPPNGKAECSLPMGIGFATAISRSIVTGAADADATATGVADVVGDIFFA